MHLLTPGLASLRLPPPFKVPWDAKPPFEGLALRKEDSLLLYLFGQFVQACFLRVLTPKTRLIGARRQLAKIEDAIVINFLTALVFVLEK